MVEHDEVAAEGVTHLDPDFGTDEHRTEVVPHAEASVEVDIAGETTVGDGAQIESRGTHATELGPSRLRRRRAVDRDDGVGQLDFGPGGKEGAVSPRAPAPGRLEPVARGVIVHERHPRTVPIDDAQARRVPGQTERRVGRPVERIDDGHRPVPVPAQPALLAEHPEPGPAEHAEHRFVGGDVGGVLIGPQTRRTPVDPGREGRHHRVGGPMENLENPVAGHRRSEPRHRAPGTDRGDVSRRFRGRLGAMAVIDLQGFVADLKDHVAEHGFHVHDERHFIETYTNRQTWEIDLHPDRACDGPLDMHVALEVDPRSLIHFEDEVNEIGEDREPSDDIKLPVTLSFALPPLPAGPDLLVLATDLAGIGGTDLPLEVSAVDSFAAVTDAAERAVSIVARVEVPLAQIYLGQEVLCDVLDRCQKVAEFLLDRAPAWLDEL